MHTTTLRELGTALPHRPHRLDHHLLMLVTAGHGGQSIDFVTHPCRPGTLLWARPGQVVRQPRQTGLDAILVCWRRELLASVAAEAPALADAFGPTFWQLAGEDEDAVINEVSQLVVDCERQRAGDLPAELLRHQLAVLMLRVATLSAPGAAVTGPPTVTAPPTVTGPAVGTVAADNATYVRLRRDLERLYTRTRRVEDYAARLGCSVRTLTRACLAATGRSAKQVIDDRAALEARRLLACTTLPVAEIGQRLGFPEPTNFGRFFHREVGCSPGAFRARAQAGDRPVPAPRRPDGVGD